MTCAKIAYETKREAVAVIQAMKKARRIKSQDKLTPYQCKWCGYYHLTSHDRRFKVRKKVLWKGKEGDEKDSASAWL